MKSILMNTFSVNAILEGRKSMTRRIIKHRHPVYDDPESISQYKFGYIEQGEVYFRDKNGRLMTGIKFPYQIGDILYVKEIWCLVDDTELGGKKWIDYKATPKYERSYPAGWENAPRDVEALKWKSPRYMPKKYSRITLKVTNVKVEKLQDISIDDIEKEGIKSPIIMKYMFKDLWNSINEKKGYGWDLNPWVWCISFKRVKEAINE